jgi:uncharacterized protein (TIGR02594 family)
MDLKFKDPINVNNVRIAMKGLEHYGTSEIKGKEDNGKIMQFLHKIDPNVMHDETPWCSGFLYSVLESIGIKVNVTLAARSWLKVGKEVLIPKTGDIVVLWRGSPKSWKGHAGILIKEDVNNVYVLGGNQVDSVNIMRYPKLQVLGYRRFSDDMYSVNERIKKMEYMFPTYEKQVKARKKKTK